jgi:hypothetical protein
LRFYKFFFWVKVCSFFLQRQGDNDHKKTRHRAGNI